MVIEILSHYPWLGARSRGDAGREYRGTLGCWDVLDLQQGGYLAVFTL